MTSRGSEDERNEYCGHCHEFKGERQYPRELITELLSDVASPEAAVDGDCLVYADRVTKALRSAGLNANPILLAGYITGSKALMYLHRVTRAHGWIVDFTVQQFSSSLPARYIARRPLYIHTLSTITQADVRVFEEVVRS